MRLPPPSTNDECPSCGGGVDHDLCAVDLMPLSRQIGYCGSSKCHGDIEQRVRNQRSRAFALEGRGAH